tara:strand:- start:399 stop:1154 length:756 start_codon:yes stop_codon:yes gene_type:complete
MSNSGAKLMMAAATGGVAPFTYDAVTFDGTNDYLTRGADLTGNVNGKSGLISAWLKTDSNSANRSIWRATTADAEIEIYRRSDNKVWVTFQDTGQHRDIFYKSGTSLVSADGWVHWMFAWDTAAGVSEMYFDGVQDSPSLDTNVNDTLDYTNNNHHFFASTSGAQKWDGDVSEFYITLNETLDITSSTNRAKFSDGSPVSLGADGSGPTGNSPIIYLHIDEEETANNFADNAGTGGGMTVNGALTTAATKP